VAVPAPAPVAGGAAPTGEDDDLSWAGCATLSHLRVPAIVDDPGIEDLSGVVTHALMEERDGARRDALRARLVAELVRRPSSASVPCIVRHLREAASAPVDSPERGRIELLASVIDQVARTHAIRAGAW